MNPSVLGSSLEMRVLAIDPGMTTGFVTADFYRDHISLSPYQKSNTTCFWLWQALNFVKPHHLVCEDFEFRRNLEWAELFPVQLIGICNLYVQSFPKSKLSMQKASVIHGKSKIQGKWVHTAYYHDKEKLKEKDVYIPGEAFEHSMDAMRHFLQWYTFGAGYKYHRDETQFKLVKP